MFSPGRKSSSRIMHPAKTLNGSLPALSGLSILTQGDSEIANGNRLIAMCNQDRGGPIYGGSRYYPLN